ncbi:hypothetical protein MTO96_047581 [Rhipicephalus appendiculatus]
MYPLELKRLVLLLQRRHISGRMSPEEVRRVTTALGHLGLYIQYIRVRVTASGATTSAEPVVDDTAGGSPGTGDDQPVSGGDDGEQKEMTKLVKEHVHGACTSEKITVAIDDKADEKANGVKVKRMV